AGTRRAIGEAGGDHMTVVRRQATSRWLAVAVVVAVLCAVPGIVAAWPVPATRVDPGVLRARIRASANQPYQGYALSSAALGLPALPRLSDVTSLFDGSTQLRAWYSSATRWR